MELEIKKNIKAAVYVDDQRLIDLDNSSVFSKVENDEVYIFIKHKQTGQSIKLIIKQYAEEIDDNREYTDEELLEIQRSGFDLDMVDTK